MSAPDHTFCAATKCEAPRVVVIPLLAVDLCTILLHGELPVEGDQRYIASARLGTLRARPFLATGTGASKPPLQK